MFARNFIFSLLVLCSSSVAIAQSNSIEDASIVATYCVRGADGYVTSIPKGWVNRTEIASQLNLCAFYMPEGKNFKTIEYAIYPRTTLIPSNTPRSEIIKAVVDNTLKSFHSIAGGDKLTAKKLETLTTKEGLEFEIWLFDEGPTPNNYEAVAYYVNTKTVFFLVLSAKTKAQRDNALPVLKETVNTMQKFDLSKK